MRGLEGVELDRRCPRVAVERMEGKKTRTKILPAGSLKSKVMLSGRSTDVCFADGNRAGPRLFLGNRDPQGHPQVYVCGPCSDHSPPSWPSTAPWPFSRL